MKKRQLSPLVVGGLLCCGFLLFFYARTFQSFFSFKSLVASSTDFSVNPLSDGVFFSWEFLNRVVYDSGDAESKAAYGSAKDVEKQLKQCLHREATSTLQFHARLLQLEVNTTEVVQDLSRNRAYDAKMCSKKLYRMEVNFNRTLVRLKHFERYFRLGHSAPDPSRKWGQYFANETGSGKNGSVDNSATELVDSSGYDGSCVTTRTLQLEAKVAELVHERDERIRALKMPLETREKEMKVEEDRLEGRLISIGDRENDLETKTSELKSLLGTNNEKLRLLLGALERPFDKLSASDYQTLRSSFRDTYNAMESFRRTLLSPEDIDLNTLESNV